MYLQTHTLPCRVNIIFHVTRQSIIHVSCGVTSPRFSDSIVLPTYVRQDLTYRARLVTQRTHTIQKYVPVAFDTLFPEGLSILWRYKAYGPQPKPHESKISYNNGFQASNLRGYSGALHRQLA